MQLRLHAHWPSGYRHLSPASLGAWLRGVPPKLSADNGRKPLARALRDMAEDVSVFCQEAGPLLILYWIMAVVLWIWPALAAFALALLLSHSFFTSSIAAASTLLLTVLWLGRPRYKRT
jgi:hypothetical protein